MWKFLAWFSKYFTIVHFAENVITGNKLKSINGTFKRYLKVILYTFVICNCNCNCMTFVWHLLWCDITWHTYLHQISAESYRFWKNRFVVFVENKKKWSSLIFPDRRGEGGAEGQDDSPQRRHRHRRLHHRQRHLRLSQRSPHGQWRV